MPLPASGSMAMFGLIGTVVVGWVLSLLLWSRSPLRVPVAVLSLATVA